jgi:hypothetical protein
MTDLNSQASQTYTVNAVWSSSNIGAVNKSDLVLTGSVTGNTMSVEINETLATVSGLRVLDIDDIYTITATITQSGLTSIPSSSVVVYVQPSVQVTSMKTLLSSGSSGGSGAYTIEFEWKIINTDLLANTPVVYYSIPAGGSPEELPEVPSGTPGLRKSTLSGINPLEQYTIEFTGVGRFPTIYPFTTGSIPTVASIIIIPDVEYAMVYIIYIDQPPGALIDWDLSSIQFTIGCSATGAVLPLAVDTNIFSGQRITAVEKDHISVPQYLNNSSESRGRFTIGGLQADTEYTFNLDLKNSVGPVSSTINTGYLFRTTT